VEITPDNSGDNNADNKMYPDNKSQETIIKRAEIKPQAPEAETIYDYRSLSGNEKKLLGIIFHECLREGGLETGKLPMAALSHQLGVKLGTAKMTMHRLKKKGFVTSIEALKIKGGWSRYKITKDLYQKLQNDDQFFSFDPTRITKRITKEITIPSSSSRLNNNLKKTNTRVPDNNTHVLPQDWLEIRTPENVKSIGFGQTQIKQLHRLGTLSSTDVQDSLDALSYDLDNGEVKSRGPKLNFFMGIMRTSGSYVSEVLLSEMKTEIEANEARIQMLAEMKKKEAEEGLTRKAQEILSQMTDEEKRAKVPENPIAKFGSLTHERLLLAEIKAGLVD